MERTLFDPQSGQSFSLRFADGTLEVREGNPAKGFDTRTEQMSADQAPQRIEALITEKVQQGWKDPESIPQERARSQPVSSRFEPEGRFLAFLDSGGPERCSGRRFDGAPLVFDHPEKLWQHYLRASEPLTEWLGHEEWPVHLAPLAVVDGASKEQADRFFAVNRGMKGSVLEWTPQAGFREVADSLDAFESRLEGEAHSGAR